PTAEKTGKSGIRVFLEHEGRSKLDLYNQKQKDGSIYFSPSKKLKSTFHPCKSLTNLRAKNKLTGQKTYTSKNVWARIKRFDPAWAVPSWQESTQVIRSEAKVPGAKRREERENFLHSILFEGVVNHLMKKFPKDVLLLNGIFSDSYKIWDDDFRKIKNPVYIMCARDEDLCQVAKIHIANSRHVFNTLLLCLSKQNYAVFYNLNKAGFLDENMRLAFLDAVVKELVTTPLLAAGDLLGVFDFVLSSLSDHQVKSLVLPQKEFQDKQVFQKASVNLQDHQQAVATLWQLQSLMRQAGVTITRGSHLTGLVHIYTNRRGNLDYRKIENDLSDFLHHYHQGLIEGKHRDELMHKGKKFVVRDGILVTFFHSKKSRGKKVGDPAQNAGKYYHILDFECIGKGKFKIEMSREDVIKELEKLEVARENFEQHHLDDRIRQKMREIVQQAKQAPHVQTIDLHSFRAEVVKSQEPLRSSLKQAARKLGWLADRKGFSSEGRFAKQVVTVSETANSLDEFVKIAQNHGWL
ncbi:MAG: hypothetical protein AAF310_03785, partial [Myxococcota bacterium]